MGVVGRPHGVRGLVHVTSFAAEPADLATYPLQDESGRRLVLQWRGQSIAAIGEVVDGATRWVRDRDAAARLTNLRLYVPRAALPPAGEDEFYLADLLGMAAHDATGQFLGNVTAVHDYGAGASLEIGALILPFTRACVPEIDLAARRLTVLPPHEVIGEDT
ncbi:MAG: 16S rRNA processing protein RimM [Rhodospirillales bacterium]|nr:16S rRNA processing protein RimM [Rhodospirillales bacterium]